MRAAARARTVPLRRGLAPDANTPYSASVRVGRYLRSTPRAARGSTNPARRTRGLGTTAGYAVSAETSTLSIEVAAFMRAMGCWHANLAALGARIPISGRGPLPAGASVRSTLRRAGPVRVVLLVQPIAP